MSEAEEIEERSFRMIEERLGSIPLPEREVMKRVIHATADFDFSSLLVFKNNPVLHGIRALRHGKNIVTDVRMVEAGISREAVKKCGSEVKCFIDSSDAFTFSRNSGKTRARSAFHVFKHELDGSVVVIGNAPTALLELCEVIKKGIKPSLVIATPPGFVGAKEAKEKILGFDVPSIVVRGSKGGSTVAVAVVNALLQLAGEESAKGYATGTCAAAAAKASAEMLFSGRILEYAEVELPAGGVARLKIQDAVIGENFARCCVLKDAGGDSDVTHGTKICALAIARSRDLRTSIRSGRARFRQKDGVAFHLPCGIARESLMPSFLRNECFAITRARLRKTALPSAPPDGQPKDPRPAIGVARAGRKIILKGGEGVGMVTKKGLQVKVGEPAINPVPRKMICREVRKVLPRGKGVEITVFVPEGKKLAKRTMNERLGIVNGISIIGTTGVVEPKSEDAFRRALTPQIDVALAAGHKEIVLTPGNIGEGSAIKRGIPSEAIVQTGNFVGYMLEECRKRGVKKALLFGSAGKLCKVAAGIFNTHSKVADGRMETIAAHASLLGADRKTVKLILGANTTEAALEILGERHCSVFDSIAEKASARASEYVGKSMEFGTVILSLRGAVIGKDENSRGSKWAKYLL